MSMSDEREQQACAFTAQVCDILKRIDDARTYKGTADHEDPITILKRCLIAAERRGMELAAVAERERCARDVCMYCGGRALGYGPVRRNSAGSYYHPHESGTERDVLCAATSIWSRHFDIARIAAPCGARMIQRLTDAGPEVVR